MDVEFKRKLLKEWLQLEEIRSNILEAAENRRYAELSAAVEAYINSAASNIEWKGNWFETLEAFNKAVKTNLPTLQFALLKAKTKTEKLPWEYEGRTWYYWLNIFSNSYGWSEKSIAELDIDTALGLLQEILIQEQLSHEWEWSLTELAYPYNETTKKSSFRALPRPDWMKKIIPKRKVMIRKDLLPVGVIIGEAENPKS